MDRRKELKEFYKNIKKEMGIFIIRSNFSNKCFIQETMDLKSLVNRTRFSLEFGNYPVQELQKDWKEYGKENFVIEVLDNLSYDKDESKTDYSEELAILKMTWEEKLSKEGMEFYIK